MSTYTAFPQSTTVPPARSAAAATVHPLRPYYAPHQPQLYIPGTSPNGAAAAAAAASHYDDLDEILDSRAAAKELANFAVLKFLTTAVASPFEVGKTLLQVQYLPSEDAEDLTAGETGEREEEELYAGNGGGNNGDAELSSDSDSDDFYGTRSRERHHKRRHSAGGTPLSSASLDPTSAPFRRKVAQDEGGYIVRPDPYDDATRPAYQVTPIDGGVWDAMSAVVKQPVEGWRGLFKGQYMNWLYEMLHLFLQPTLEGTFNDLFDLYDDTIPLVHLDTVGPNVATLVASHLVVGVLLSPLELVRTRLIVQTSSPLHKKYSGPIHALRTIISEEGGVQGLYLSHNLLPTILYHTLIPLLSNTAPLIIDRVLRVSASDSPFLYGLAELALNTLELCITLPLDTIRKRLQIQVRSRTPGKRLETVVAVRPAPYANAGDVLIKIMKEEGSKRSKGERGSRRKREEETPGQRRKRRGVLGGWGLRGLYRGFGMQFSANAMLFLFHAINGIEDDFEDF